MNRFASTGEIADPCGVPRSREQGPVGQRQSARPATAAHTAPPTDRSVWASTALTMRSDGTLSKNFWMSRSITQSVFQQRSRHAATASSADRTGDSRRSRGGRSVRPSPPAPGHHRLRHPVRDRRHPQDSRPTAMRLRYLHRLHRRRKVGPRRHPIPDLVQVVLQILSRTPRWTTPSTPGAPLFAFTC